MFLYRGSVFKSVTDAQTDLTDFLPITADDLVRVSLVIVSKVYM